ncbi:hypothetical protein [Streptomyces hainanensis]|uniref:hypothetical protein n=1 Tax=Streptomyces hainanensis TaxID=402648 RepID=UPI0014044AEA|nr:hypothetical protein [Streptomyces hainanensis]
MIARGLGRPGGRLDRLPDVEPAIATTELTHHPSPWQRGPTALPVRFTPMPASR